MSRPLTMETTDMPAIASVERSARVDALLEAVQYLTNRAAYCSRSAEDPRTTEQQSEIWTKCASEILDAAGYLRRLADKAKGRV